MKVATDYRKTKINWLLLPEVRQIWMQTWGRLKERDGFNEPKMIKFCVRDQREVCQFNGRSSY